MPLLELLRCGPGGQLNPLNPPRTTRPIAATSRKRGDLGMEHTTDLTRPRGGNPGMIPEVVVTMRVNDVLRQLQVDVRVTLLDALRPGSPAGHPPAASFGRRYRW